MDEEIKVFNDISPYVRRAWDGHMLFGWSLKERVIFDYEFIYIMEGEGVIMIDDVEYQASSGDLFFIKPGIPHQMKATHERGLRQPHVHFDFVFDRYSDEIKICYRPYHRITEQEKKYFRKDPEILEALGIPVKLTLKDRNTIEKLIFDMIKTLEQKDPAAMLRCKSLMIILIIKIYDEISGNKKAVPAIPGLQHEKLNVIREYILLNYRSVITLDDLVEMSNMSKNHLIRCFKKVFAESPIQYLISIRIERAKQLINESHSSISEIAGYLGFSDLQYFSRTFRKHTGKSPSDYKKSMFDDTIR